MNLPPVIGLSCCVDKYSGFYSIPTERDYLKRIEGAAVIVCCHRKQPGHNQKNVTVCPSNRFLSQRKAVQYGKSLE